MIDKKRLQQIRDKVNDQSTPFIFILAGEIVWLIETVNDLQDEVGSLDEQLDMCRREGYDS